MTRVKFHDICDHDHCTATSPEYVPLPACRDCLRMTCPTHAEPGTETDPDVDTPSTVVCRDCWADFHAESAPADDEHERAAAHARDNDFEDTNGEDWT